MSEEASKILKKIGHILSNVHLQPMEVKERMEKAIDLADCFVLEKHHHLLKEEKKREQRLYKLVKDPIGRSLTVAILDQGFRSNNPYRIADQLIYLRSLYGISKLSFPFDRLRLYFVRDMIEKWAPLLVPLLLNKIRKRGNFFFLPAEKDALHKILRREKQSKDLFHCTRCQKETLGKRDKVKGFKAYLNDLKNPWASSFSVPFSSFGEGGTCLSWSFNLETFAKRLRSFYQVALENKKNNKAFLTFLAPQKYEELDLSVVLFKKVLLEPEFMTLPAGITLPAYFPDSMHFLKELAEFAQKRVDKGGAPIHIQIVKGDYYFLEQVNASLSVWPQAPFQNKKETDANFKTMLLYVLDKKYQKALRVRLATHNLFDICFALLLKQEKGLHDLLSFQVVRGLGNWIYRLLKAIDETVFLDCKVVTKAHFCLVFFDFMRFLDEEVSFGHFFSESFQHHLQKKSWKKEIESFRMSCQLISQLETKPRRMQNRLLAAHAVSSKIASFENNPEIDFSLRENQQWIETILEKWKKASGFSVPLLIGGKEYFQENLKQKKYDLLFPEKILYEYMGGTLKEIENALVSGESQKEIWANVPIARRREILFETVHKLREKRGDLIGALLCDMGKTILEADHEVSSAIDHGEYALHLIEQLDGMHDIKWHPKGIILLYFSWNDSLSLLIQNIFAALLSGNVVFVLPSRHTVFLTFQVVKLFLDTELPKELLQFIPIQDSQTYKYLMQDKRVNAMCYSGFLEKAKEMISLRPGLDFWANFEGKNSMIISAVSDREEAVLNLLTSAFNFNGQKKENCSLALIENELYKDSQFIDLLIDAAKSLKVGSFFEVTSDITPLMFAPNEKLHRAMTQLEPGEFWLLKPKQDATYPHLYSPGIKGGVQKGSFTQKEPFFGPVLGIIAYENLDQAIHLANATPYGLTSGLHSLDRREQKKWKSLISAGNCYINCPMIYSKAKQQPFGGDKNSFFGPGRKGGGPNYLMQFMKAKQVGMPKEKFPVGEWVNNLTRFLEKFDLSAEELGIWYASISSYAFFWQQFKRKKDFSKIIGQDNFFSYFPYKKMSFRIGPNDRPLDYLRVFAATLTCQTHLEVSWEKGKDIKVLQANWGGLLPIFNLIEENEESFIKRIQMGRLKRVRMVKPPSDQLKEAAAAHMSYIDATPVSANGRVELLHYLRELSFSMNYHRKGNLGLREGELRSFPQ